MSLRFRAETRSHPGKVRSVNEDAVLARDDAGLWLVADGMGGHVNGQWASRTLVAHFASLDLSDSSAPRAEVLLRAFQAANRTIFGAAQSAGATMGTTGVLLFRDGDAMSCAWIGDSRAYRWRAGALKRLTRDHTLVQDMVDRGSLAPEEVEAHPMSHVLSRAIGTEAAPLFDGVSEPPAPGDRFLLCSDGLTKVVGDDEIAVKLAMAPAEAADALIACALDRGAPDNVSLVLILVEGGA
jgi:serine/threonine protein phosphatase PrpC